MGETGQNTAIDPRTCPLRDFEGRTWADIPPEGQKRIFCAYQDYFDGLTDHRKRAIGYCVIMGGVAPRKIGTLDAMLCRDTKGGYLWGIAQDGRVCLLDDARLIGALDDYIATDPRLRGLWDSVQPGERTTAPLFVPVRNGKHERLHDCLYFMWGASKAVGFNAQCVCLNRMNDDPIRSLPWRVDDNRINQLLFAITEIPLLVEQAKKDPGFAMLSSYGGGLVVHDD